MPTTPSGGIETAADNAGTIAIAISRVAVAGAIAVSRIAVAGSPIAIAVRRVIVSGPITAVTAVVRPRSERGTDCCCPERRPAPAPSAAAPTAPFEGFSED